MLVGEVFYRSFGNRREVASYVGLAPSPFKCGKMSHDQGISMAGNPRARTTMIELAWLSVLRWSRKIGQVAKRINCREPYYGRYPA